MQNQEAIQIDTTTNQQQEPIPTEPQSQDTRLVGETGLGFVKRDQGVKNEEELGLLKFMVVKNDKTLENMRHLIDLKNIIAKQLPKMPRNYIVKLIMDRQHEAMIIVRYPQGKRPQIIGGCVFRPFKSQRFAEIVFLAITTSEQVRGFGTRLMNRLKAHAQKEGIQYFLTYADNLAIEFFKKQGFNQKGQMHEARWKGYIKDYSGSTMMQCQIHSDISYVDLSDDLKKQRDKILDEINRIIFLQRNEGLRFDQGKAHYEFDEIFGLKEAGWTQKAYELAKAAEERTFQEQCQKILKILWDHENSRVFRKPVDAKKVTDYYQFIKEPMDLERIQKNLNDNQYHTAEQFKKDLIKIFDNARTYNTSETIYYKYADQLQNLVKPMLDRMKDNATIEKDLKLLNQIPKEANQVGDIDDMEFEDNPENQMSADKIKNSISESKSNKKRKR
ncbi:histone acetyltransferase gcn5-like [Stylonychia lemnae]|uniref:histone acetyltransferase n=1 Tax=Stylonychia lemnae TaxID=5949 RepID=A0A078AIP6_STYLE|nr:histone acetyltransferase gcn5-like [Stylonychia lemnae]|eukprot:CDW81357.1 histone acetyltransferase gcn5-like [Stylonychia lemnae]